MTTLDPRMRDEDGGANVDHLTHERRSSSLKVLAWPAFENKTGNPYTRLLYEAMEDDGTVQVEGISPLRALTGNYDLWHVHWPDDFLSYRSLTTAATYVFAELVLFAWARLRGAKLVWTVHDLGPHESRHPGLERMFWRFFLPMVDGIVSLSEAARQKARDRFPTLRSVPSAVVPHGHYRSAYPDPVPKSDARRTLDLSPDARVATFVGRIRPYKNVASLVQAFRQWEAPAARLLLAGNPVSECLSAKIQTEAAGDSRIQTMLRFIEEEEMPPVLGTSDLVVLPYETIMHSGTAVLALSFDRPVLVPARGAMTELQEQVGADWVRTYSEALTPDLLADAMDWAETESRSAQAPLDDLEWSSLARQTVALYARVLKAHD